MNPSSEFDHPPSDADTTLPGGAQHLPPVDPPSAGFIVQLFLVPALIVGVIVGVYFLFGRLASGDLDWRQQVVDVRSQNEHVRWRGALGLAQMLDADAQQGTAGQGLARNPEIAAALTELFHETRARSPRDDETISQLEFVAKALGRLDVPDAILPVLFDAIEADPDPVLHKHSLNAVVMIVGRAYEREAPLTDPALVSRLITVSEGADVLSRHQAAFALGLISTPEARTRLLVLLQDGDQMTRINAAIALARHDSAEGLPVFEEVFADIAARPLDPAAAKTDVLVQEYFERKHAYSNCLKAVGVLQSQLDPDARRRLSLTLETVAATTADAQVKVETRQALIQLAGN